jgi:hypothetical protein
MKGELMLATDADVTSCAKRIHAANTKFGKQFTQWVQVVGAELQAAQKSLANHKNGAFAKWCRDEFGWGTSHAHRLMDASVTIECLISSPIGEDKRLPDSESHCRELAAVPKTQVAKVWQEVVEHAERESKPITAKLVREHTKQYRTDADEKPRKDREFDEDAAGSRLRDWLRAELEKWPEKYRPEAAHWVRQILTKEFNL